MVQNHYIFGGRVSNPMIIKINTALGTGASFTITTRYTGTNLFDVDWGDGIKTYNHTGNNTHNYSSHGIYIIKIYRRFRGFYINNGGDKLKITDIISWGNLKQDREQNLAFYGCLNLKSLPTDSTFLNTIQNGVGMFSNTGLETLPSSLTLNSLINGTLMFTKCKLSSLPDGLVLPNLVYCRDMFSYNKLTQLPSTLVLNHITNGDNMFLSNLLTSLPDNMALTNLVDGSTMFYMNAITHLPSSMTLNNLVNGYGMFSVNNLSSLPSNMNLNGLENGQLMFRNNILSAETSLPTNMKLSSLKNGTNMFQGVKLDTLRYSKLLIDMNSTNPNNNVPFNAGGTTKYTSTATGARTNLVTNKGWTITDGGMI